MNKKCNYCKEMLSEDKFWGAGGKRNNLQCYCKNCLKLYKRQWRKKQKSTETGRKNGTIDNLYFNSKSRAENKNLIHSITREDIDKKLTDRCPVLDFPYLFCQGQAVRESPSIDKFDNTKGYTIENIRIISTRANRIKSDGTLEEFEKIYEYMLKYSS